MKRNIFYCIAILACAFLINQKASAQVAINTDGAAPNGSAMLDVKSTDKGILIPRVAGTGSIASPVQGLLIYSTSDDSFYYYDGGTWLKLATGTITPSQWTTTGSDIYYNSGGVAIGNTGVDGSAILDINSTTKGILIPRLSESDRLSISSPVQGLLVYQNDNGAYSEGFYYYSVDWHYLFNTTSSVLPVSQGGTGLSNVTTGNIIFGSSSTNFASTSNLSYNNSILKITGTLNADGNIINKVTTIAGNTTLSASHNIIISNGTSVVIALPAASGNTGRTYTIKNINATSVTIDPNASEQIEGALTYTLAQNKSVRIVCNGSAWYIIAGF